MNTLFVKKGDNVKIIAGKNKGRTGKVSAVDPSDNRVVVDGWNIVVKHVKPRGPQKPGGKQKISGPIDASNVQILCPACSAATRVAAGLSAEGKHIRLCKKCGASLDVKAKTEKKVKKDKKDKAEAAAPKSDKKAKADTAEAKPKTVKKSVKKTDKTEG